MAKVKIKVFIHKCHMTGNFVCFMHDMTDRSYVLVGEHEFEYEIPEDFNPVAAEVASLNKQLDLLAMDYAANVRRMKSRIHDLRCLDNGAA